MNNSLKQFAARILALFMVCVGYVCFAYWVYTNGFSIVAFLVGLVGFFITYNPAMEIWKKFFNDLFKVKSSKEEENK